MGDKSRIEWTEATWNPVAAFLKDAVTVKIGGVERTFLTGTRGWFCTKVSPGCANCYAEGINVRLGNGLQYLPVNLDKIEFRLVNLDAPLRWRRRRMVFVNSMTDLFHEAIPTGLRDRVFAVMALARQHTFQVLTKRATVMRDYCRSLYQEQRLAFALGSYVGDVIKADRRAGNELHKLASKFIGRTLPLRNVWLGVSAEDQQRADLRIPSLLQTPAAIRFLSCEPLLGPVILWRAINDPTLGDPARFVDWVIVGGESGKNARPCNIEWIRDLVKQCKSAGVPVFVKQLGAYPVDNSRTSRHTIGTDQVHMTKDRKGGDPAEWPEDLRVREFPARAII